MSPADMPTVMGVRDYLTQVVLNLVLNAIDATDDQGRIHVAARPEDDSLVLTVEDDGRGISIADRCRLFQPFFTTKAHGTGLGLFVSRQILEDHAGTLSFESESGRGSTFFVRIPAEPMRAEHAARDLAGLTPALLPEPLQTLESSGSPPDEMVVVGAVAESDTGSLSLGRGLG